MIQHDEFKKMIEAGEDTLLIQVSSREVYEAGHIAGSHNIPWDGDACVAAVQAQSTGSNQRIILCGDGGPADDAKVQQARDQLRAAGFARVGRLAGGVSGWQRAGLPVVTGSVSL